MGDYALDGCELKPDVHHLHAVRRQRDPGCGQHQSKQRQLRQVV